MGTLESQGSPLPPSFMALHLSGYAHMRLCPWVSVCGCCVQKRGGGGAGQAPGCPWRVNCSTISPSPAALVLGPRGTSVAGRAGGHVYLAPWGPDHMPRPTRPPLPLSPQSPPGSSKNPRTRSECRGAWPPSCVRPRVTPSHG